MLWFRGQAVGDTVTAILGVLTARTKEAGPLSGPAAFVSMGPDLDRENATAPGSRAPVLTVLPAVGGSSGPGRSIVLREDGAKSVTEPPKAGDRLLKLGSEGHCLFSAESGRSRREHGQGSAQILQLVASVHGVERTFDPLSRQPSPSGKVIG
jgi:hypothetical protein